MSPRASHDAKEGRRSWRYAKSSSQATGSKKPYIVFLTLLLLGLVGVYWWAMWRTPNRNAHLAVIEVPANRRVATTPFAHNDVQHLLGVNILRTRKEWEDIRDNSDFAVQVGPKAQDLLKKPYDKLILYINAPGISHAGEAYLAHSDFLTPGAALEGRHAVSDILAQVANAGPGVKLIVLDSTSVDVDPRLGLVVNEFVRSLEADVKELDQDSNLFVFVPAGPFQVSTTAYGDRQSLFGRYLADGLAGAADRQVVGDGDLFVTLYELYEYVRVGCAISIDSSSGVEQTPVLLQAGIGYVPPSADLNTEPFRLTDVTGQDTPTDEEPPEAIEETGDTSAENQTDKAALHGWPIARTSNLAWLQATAGNKEDPAESTAEPKKEPAAEKQPVTPAASTAEAPPPEAEAAASPAPPPAEKAAPAELTPQELLLSKLDKAWQLRDAIQNPKTHEVTPATFAPHLWRALEAELLFLERQVLADPVFDPPKAATEDGEAEPVLSLSNNVAEKLEDLIRRLTALDAAISSKLQLPVPANDTSPLARLLNAWNRYVKNQLEDEANYTLQEAPEIVQLRNQAREVDWLVYSLPYYVRWHARAHQSLSIESDQHRRLEDYLDATLQLARTLSSLRAKPQLDYSGKRRLEEEVSGPLARAVLLRSRLDDALWEGDDRGNPIILERLLATPLLDAQRRMQLFRALIQVPPKEPDVAAPEARKDLTVSQKQWQRLQAHCLLELRLVELALGANHARVNLLTAELAEAGKLADAGGPEADLWDSYRRVGDQLGQCLEFLPKSILNSPAEDYAIHIVDYRDVDDPANVDLDARPALQLHLKYEPEVKVEIAEEKQRSEFDLKLNATRQLVLKIRGTREKDVSEPLAPVESALLDVICNRPAGPPEKKSGWYEQTVICDVRAKDGVTQSPARKTTDVTFWSPPSKRLNQQLILTFTLPRPDQISLEVLRLSTRPQQFRQEQDGSLTLGLFPANLPKPAVTEFQFRAHNESGKDRKLRAELYVVKPGRPELQKKHGTISKDRRKELFREQANSLDLEQLELVAAVDDVNVAVGKSAVLAFQAPGAAPPEAAPPASPPEKPGGPPALTEANHGMVCVLRDEADTKWVKWIETEPIPLHRYLAAKSWYQSGQVVVEVTGKLDFDKDFPAHGLTLTWDTKPDFPEGTTRRIDATIMKPGDEDKLYVDVQPDGLTRDVYIGVNGCPRVLAFSVPCRASRDKVAGVETRIGRRSIAITKLSMFSKGQATPKPDQVYHIPIAPREESASVYLDAGEKLPEGESLLKPNEKPIVPMTAEKKLRIQLHVDAPVEGLVPGRGDEIKVLVGGEPFGFAYDDRRLRTNFMDLGDNGVVRLGLQVAEQFIDIEPRDSNEELPLHATLTVDNWDPIVSQKIPVIFDNARPRITDVNVPAQLDLESKTVVELEVEELSGISEVRYWFSASREQAVEKPLKAALLGTPVKDGKTLRAKFNVDTSGMDEGRYFLSFQIDDRVSLTSDVVQTMIQIKKKVVQPVAATIWGTIAFERVAHRNFTTVKLLTKEGEEIPGFEAKVDAKNQYKFADQVPAGEYVVHAECDLNPKKVVDKPVKVEKSGPLPVNLSLK